MTPSPCRIPRCPVAALPGWRVCPSHLPYRQPSRWRRVQLTAGNMVAAKFRGGPLHGMKGLKAPAWLTPELDFEEWFYPDLGRRPKQWPVEWGPAWIIVHYPRGWHFYSHKRNSSPTLATYRFAGTRRFTGTVTTAAEDAYLRQAGTVADLSDGALLRIFPGTEIEHVPPAMKSLAA